MSPAPSYLHPSLVEVLQYFTFQHLPPHLQTVSRPFAALAAQVAKRGGGLECTVALRKLLEAKDAAVRAALSSPGAATRVDSLMSSVDPEWVVAAEGGQS